MAVDAWIDVIDTAIPGGVRTALDAVREPADAQSDHGRRRTPFTARRR